jgi:hypothetical protein
VDVDIAPPPISADILRLLDTDYMGHENVDEAIGEIGHRSLRAEVNRYRRLERKRRSFQESIRRLEDQMFTTDVERRMCVSRLEAARAMVRIQAECRVIGKRFDCLHGRWNVGVYPEKGMMLRF